MSLRVLKALLWAAASLPAEGPRREAASVPFLISCSASSSVCQHARLAFRRSHSKCIPGCKPWAGLALQVVSQNELDRRRCSLAISSACKDKL